MKEMRNAEQNPDAHVRIKKYEMSKQQQQRLLKRRNGIKNNPNFLFVAFLYRNHMRRHIIHFFFLNLFSLFPFAHLHCVRSLTHERTNERERERETERKVSHTL